MRGIAAGLGGVMGLDGSGPVGRAGGPLADAGHAGLSVAWADTGSEDGILLRASDLGGSRQAGLVGLGDGIAGGRLTSRLPDPLRDFAAAALAEEAYQGVIPAAWSVAAAKMISTRTQDHIVETPDGHIHMLINQGTEGLMMLSSADGGVTWTEGLQLAATGALSSSDMRLLPNGETLGLAFVGNRDVSLAGLDYDPLTGNWSLLLRKVVDAGIEAPDTVHPSLAVTSNGRIIIAYTEETPDGLRMVLRWSDDVGQSWDTTEAIMPGTESGTLRAVETANGMGFLFATPDSLQWWTPNPQTGWTIEEINTSGALGRYASHFTAVEVDGNVVAANVGADGDVDVLYYDAAAGEWLGPLTPPGAGNATSVQLSVSEDGRFFVTYDDTRTGEITVTEFVGSGWTRVAVLETPAAFNREPTRFEAPDHFSGDLVVVQQIRLASNDQVNGLYNHVIDIDGSGGVTTDLAMPPDADAFLF